jgi:hypothetical protein
MVHSFQLFVFFSFLFLFCVVCCLHVFGIYIVSISNIILLLVPLQVGCKRIVAEIIITRLQLICSSSN